MNTNVFIYLEFLRKTLSPLPGVTEKLAYGTPAFYVGKKLFARIKEDGETLVITSTERDKWMRLYPDVYFVTDHYLNYDYVLAHMAGADPEQLKEVLLIAYRIRATKKLVDEFDRLIKSSSLNV
jgi:hypothetical protein